MGIYNELLQGPAERAVEILSYRKHDNITDLGYTEAALINALNRIAKLENELKNLKESFKYVNIKDG